jgi:hypothetical protein
MTDFATAARPFLEGARIPASDLIPITPPGAKLADSSRLDPSQLGKIPGRYHPEQKAWVGLGGSVLVEGLTPNQQRKVGSWPTSNVGLRAASFPGIDIDVESEEAAALVEKAAVVNLGFAPVRVRGNSPRRLLVYKAVGDEPIRKMRLLFELGGKQHAVDVLGWGQQYIVGGVHPSGATYTWREGHVLSEWGVDGLQAVTAADLRAFIQSLSERIVVAGGRIVSRSEQSLSGTGDGVLVGDLDPVAPTELVLSALRAIPNTPEEVPHRGDLVGIASALKAALGKVADDSAIGYEFLSWACATGWADTDYAHHIWKSIKFTRSSPDTLFRKARRFGWHGDAPLDFPDDADEVDRIIDGAEDEQRASLQKVARQLVYWPSDQKWIALSTGEILSHTALNNHAIGMSVAAAGLGGVKAASAKLRNSGMVSDVVGITYHPGKPALFNWRWEGKSGLWYNSWRPGMVVPDKGVTDDEVRMFLEHWRWLLPTEEEFNTVMDWMAHLVQNPGVKVRWAPVIIGAQGIGKDMGLHPLVQTLGVANMQEIAPYQLLEKFNAFYESQLVIVQEMMRMDKVETYERVKAAITGTGAGTILIRKLYQEAYPVPNSTSFVFLTNHSDAISIAPDDRRFYVVQCEPVSRREAVYYEALAAWYRAGGVHLVARWLANRDIRHFQADSAPAWTAAKQLMLEDTLPPTSRWLFEQITQERGIYAHRSVVTSKEISDLMLTDYSIPAKVRDGFSAKTMSIGFRAAGWDRRPVQLRLTSGERARVWCRNADILGAPDAAVRTRLEKELAAKGLGVIDGGAA